jgi:signal transduction histidine kinase
MNDAARSLADRIFAGGGEMAGLIRATDWSRTPLGPIDSWPQSLRTAVSICLGSRHPIVLWWGPERWMFYNDGYRPMLGETKHPQFLGRPGEECWSEIWNIIGPMMEQVIETGEATWSEDMFLLMNRFGYQEETYFTFSYSPIRDEEGRPSGIFNACAESTKRVLADRRMKMLREMSVEARTADEAARVCGEIFERNARDMPFALVYLLDPKDEQLHLAARTGIAAGASAAPEVVDRKEERSGWPLERVVATNKVEVMDLRHFSDLPTAPWDEPAHQAMLLPIARPGWHAPAGVLVLGVSPRRAFDDDYRGFFELVAAHVATAVSNARAYEEERQRAEQLAELDRAKTAFFGNVSHEFRTPLTLILGPLEDALRDPSLSLRGDALAAVHRNALRLLRLVNTLLDFARLEASRLQSSFEPIDLPLLTGGLAGAFQSLVESAGLKLRVECPPLPEPIYVDRSHWEKIVLNLVSNAFKFTFEGEIVVRLQATDTDIELSVADTGTGIPAHELPKVFDRFQRVEGARGRSFEGTGIGLALVQELVRLHGGTVGVESTVGRGTTFIVRIPRGKDHLPEDRITTGKDSTLEMITGASTFEATQWDAQRETTEASAAVASNERILVADDNADMREYLVRLLSSRWNVEAVSDGELALASALMDPPDLVVSDVMMPRLDGVGLLRALRANERTSTIPIMLLSARAGEEAVMSGIETGADDYLVKPFSARELITRVGTHLEMTRLRRKAADVANELAETRAALLADLDRKNKELEAFSYSVSHDLRAPLRSIDGFGRILLEEHTGELGEAGRAHLERVRSAAQRMNELIDDLLELSRVERAHVQRESVNVSDLARRIGQMLAQRDPGRAVELVVEDALVAHADPRLLEIVLENLLGNAWKFTGKITSPRVEVRARTEDHGTTFFVRDNGAGFDPVRTDRLFSPFQRLHSTDEFPGTGIGLATVRRIVDRHRGRIWAEGKVDGGATVYFTLAPSAAR